MIIHFIANFPHDLFELDLKFNLDLLYERKKKDGRINITNNGQGELIKTVTGHSALLVCILNEK